MTVRGFIERLLSPVSAFYGAENRRLLDHSLAANRGRSCASTDLAKVYDNEKTLDSANKKIESSSVPGPRNNDEGRLLADCSRLYSTAVRPLPGRFPGARSIHAPLRFETSAGPRSWGNRTEDGIYVENDVANTLEIEHPCNLV